MKETSLINLGLTAVQCADLLEIGITTERELALQFYLQPDMLANLLSISKADADRILDESVKSIPQAELDRLVHEAKRPRSFGVLPPPGDPT